MAGSATPILGGNAFPPKLGVAMLRQFFTNL
jgi:hypothetical protein